MEDKDNIISSNKAVVPTLSGEKEIGFEYIPKGEGQWEINLGGKKARITQKDLFALVFYAADTDQVDKLTPVQHTEVRYYIRKHKVQALKNIKKGEFVTVRCETAVPTIVEQGLKGIIDKKNQSQILVPRTGLANLK